ncbi:MAG: M20/M25/M40 family metallo-hydrolase [Rhodocyclaceae bacterium]|nr:M20/M25/M40 family metallo-hydrolase [Rhodocyclaceae bacterium]
MLKKIVLTFAALIVVLLLAVAFNTLRHGSRQMEVPPVKAVALDANAAAQRLSVAVRLRTVSQDGKPNAGAEEFRKLHALLEQSFPRAHAVLERERVNELSLLYTWPGSDPAAKPIMLMAHQDVVPVAAGTEKDWQADPFGGEIRDGFVWGRGSWDDKGNLLAIMEAVELLIAEGYKPRQTIYLAFGHDEELGGERGAKAIAALLQSRGVKLDFVTDEGLLITEGVLKGLDRPVALIGTAEKGYLMLRTRRERRAGTLLDAAAGYRHRHAGRGAGAAGESADAGGLSRCRSRNVRHHRAGDERPEPCVPFQPVAVRSLS